MFYRIFLTIAAFGAFCTPALSGCLFLGSEQFGLTELTVATSTQAARYELPEHHDELQAYSWSVARINSSDLEEAPADPKSRFQKVISGVGRLVVLHDDEDECIVPCTVWARNKRVLVTAAHCLEGNIKRLGVHFGLIALDDDANWMEIENYIIHTGASVGDPELDIAYIVLEKDLPNTVTPLSVQSEAEVRRSQGLVVLGHPLGLQLHLSDRNCSATPIDPVINRYRLRHKCHTEKGMSGSPIVDEETLSVIAVHTSGNSGIGVGFKNYGVLINEFDYSLSLSQIKLSGITDQAEAPENVSALISYGIDENILFSFKNLVDITEGMNSVLSNSGCNLNFFVPEAHLIKSPNNFGLDSLSAISEMPGNVKFVQKIDKCGDQTGSVSFSGCSLTNTDGRSAVVRWENALFSDRMAKIVLHEIGHNAGLRHTYLSKNIQNFMHPNIETREVYVDHSQCLALQNFVYRSYEVLEETKEWYDEQLP